MSSRALLSDDDTNITEDLRKTSLNTEDCKFVDDEAEEVDHSGLAEDAAIFLEEQRAELRQIADRYAKRPPQEQTTAGADPFEELIAKMVSTFPSTNSGVPFGKDVLSKIRQELLNQSYLNAKREEFTQDYKCNIKTYTQHELDKRLLSLHHAQQVMTREGKFLRIVLERYANSTAKVRALTEITTSLKVLVAQEQEFKRKARARKMLADRLEQEAAREKAEKRARRL